jgi:hypothetical protein
MLLTYIIKCLRLTSMVKQLSLLHLAWAIPRYLYRLFSNVYYIFSTLLHCILSSMSMKNNISYLELEFPANLISFLFRFVSFSFHFRFVFVSFSFRFRFFYVSFSFLFRCGFVSFSFRFRFVFILFSFCFRFFL